MSGAIRFLFWWLFLHRRLRSRQRGSLHFIPKDAAYRAASHSSRSISPGERHPFLSGRPRPACLPALASLSASASDVPGSGFPLLLPSNGVSPPPFHLPVPVKMPVSDLDYDAIIYPKKRMSSRKYFNYCPYFIGLLWIFCG